MTEAEGVSERAYHRLRDIYRPTPEAIAQKDQTTSDYERLLGEWNGRIVATVEYRWASDCLYIRDLAVDPDHQGRGIASRLIIEIVGMARSSGLSRITLLTVKETGNAEFFERLGFSVVSQEIATWCESDRFAVLHEVRMELCIP